MQWLLKLNCVTRFSWTSVLLSTDFSTVLSYTMIRKWERCWQKISGLVLNMKLQSGMNLNIHYSWTNFHPLIDWTHLVRSFLIFRFWRTATAEGTWKAYWSTYRSQCVYRLQMLKMLYNLPTYIDHFLIRIYRHSHEFNMQQKFVLLCTSHLLVLYENARNLKWIMRVIIEHCIYWQWSIKYLAAA